MDKMSKEQFKKKWLDTHTELTMLDKLEASRQSLVKNSPGDKNIKTRGKIAGKNLIEKKCKEDRDNQLKEMLLDAVSVNAEKLVEAKNFDEAHKLTKLAISMIPQKIQSKNETTFTFADMVRRVTLEAEIPKTIDMVEDESE